MARDTKSRAVLTCIAVAGPLYATMGAAQACVRTGTEIGGRLVRLLCETDFAWLPAALFS